MAGRLIGNGSASSSTVASPSANRRTIERRVGSASAANTTSNRSGAVIVIGRPAPADTSQDGYLTERLHTVKDGATGQRDGGTVPAPGHDGRRIAMRRFVVTTVIAVGIGSMVALPAGAASPNHLERLVDGSFSGRQGF